MHSHSQQNFTSPTTGRSQQPFPNLRCLAMRQLPERWHACLWPRVRARAGARGHRSPRARVTAAPQAHTPGVEALAGASTGEEHIDNVASDLPDVETQAGVVTARWCASAGVEAQLASWEGCWRVPPPASANQGIRHTRSMELLREGCHARHALTTSSPGDWPSGGRRGANRQATTPRTISCHRGTLA